MFCVVCSDLLNWVMCLWNRCCDCVMVGMGGVLVGDGVRWWCVVWKLWLLLFVIGVYMWVCSWGRLVLVVLVDCRGYIFRDVVVVISGLVFFGMF